MALPNTNISVAMVKAELGAATNNVGQLCIHPNINKWSKWKPVRSPKISGITETDLLPNYGLKPAVYPNVLSLVNGIYNETNRPIWEYLKPRGGINEPFRLDDFRGYNHSEFSPFGLFSVTEKANNNGTNPYITASIGFNPSPINDAFEFDSRAIGMAYRKGDDGAISTVISEQGEITVRLDVTNLDVGDYQSFLFMTNTNGNIDNNIIGLEGHPKKIDFKIAVEVLDIYIQAQFDGNKVNITVTVNNETDYPVSLSGCELKIRSASNDCNSPMLQNEVSISIGNKTAPIGTSVIYTGSPIINKNAFLMWKICWSNGGLHAKNFSTFILEEPPTQW